MKKYKLKNNELEGLRRDYSAGDYLEDRDYIVYLLSRTR